MAIETAKCPKCSSDARRTGVTKEAAGLVKHMVCGTCGHKFHVSLGDPVPCVASADLPDRTIRYYGPNYGKAIHSNLAIGTATACGEQPVGDGGDQKVAVHIFNKGADRCRCGQATPDWAPPLG